MHLHSRNILYTRIVAIVLIIIIVTTLFYLLVYAQSLTGPDPQDVNNYSTLTEKES
jgi:hypothetical protein